MNVSLWEPTLDPPYLLAYAKALDLDRERFQEDLAEHVHEPVLDIISLGHRTRTHWLGQLGEQEPAPPRLSKHRGGGRGVEHVHYLTHRPGTPPESRSHSLRAPGSR